MNDRIDDLRASPCDLRFREIIGFLRLKMEKSSLLGTVAVVRSSYFCAVFEQQLMCFQVSSANVILRHHAEGTPRRGENRGPGKDDREELDIGPGIREQNRRGADGRTATLKIERRPCGFRRPIREVAQAAGDQRASLANGINALKGT